MAGRSRASDVNTLELDDISHSYGGVLAVDHLSLSVEPGELVCLLGPSGCGKTTTLRLAAGLERLQSGRIAIAGRGVATPATSAPPEARNVGMVFQDYALFPHLNVAENVAFGLHHLAVAERRGRTQAWLDRVGLSAYAEQYPHMLSGGEQQRVALARAMAPESGLMLMDEPFANLDVALRNRVRDETLAVLKESGAAALLVTHDPEEAMRMADRIAVMRRGRLVQVGAPAALYTHPADAFMVQFFNDVNTLYGVVENESVATPLGRIPVPDGPDGTPVDILVRPEGIRLNGAAGTASAAGTVPATLVEARFMGAYNLTRLRLADGSDVTARLPGALPAPSGAVTISIDPAHVFVFPRAR